MVQDEKVGIITLTYTEKKTIEAISEVIIPSDENGPGAKEAGVVYFIDRQLADGYGENAGMYNQGPFIQSGIEESITVDGIEYPGGSPKARISSGIFYQHPIKIRELWRLGTASLNKYCINKYGSEFYKLDKKDQNNVVKKLFEKQINEFETPSAKEFIHEAYNLIVAGFLSDPIHHGNRNMIGWELMASPGVNDPGETDYIKKELATLEELVRIKPKSLKDLEI